MEQKNIRNFVIMAHIDHGKSTLADRFLELTHAVEMKKMMPQFLDRMELEREKGITIKLKPVRMNYKGTKGEFILNLVDTPGHVDFSYEVSRALAAAESAILLVDATQGIQAQTLANLDLAKKQGLEIIPAVNKIDAADARVDETILEIASVLNVNPEDVMKISAKVGTNVPELLEKVMEKTPAPKIDTQKPFRALIFDSDYDSFKGVIAFIRVVDGEINSNEKIRLMATDTEADIKELGYFMPAPVAQKKISAGEIGYIATGIKEPGKVHVGDTIVNNAQFKLNNNIEPLHGYQEPKPMVFASFYPQDAADFDLLKDALGKLKLSDPSFIYEPETKEALGRGYRCGFLGTLHVEIVSERLRREFGMDLVISTPSVVYKIISQNGKEEFIYSATDWPVGGTVIKSAEEPWVLLEVVTPAMYSSPIMEILKYAEGVYKDTQYLGMDRCIVSYEIPLRQLIANLYDKIKTVSQGYGSINYKPLGFKPGKLVKLEIWIAGKREEAFSKIVSEGDAYSEGKFLVDKLKEVLPPENFSVALQAVVSGKVIARETIKARRKDVTGYLYGGDVTRKRKLLEKQKKGKKLMKEKGKVEVSHDAFLQIFKGRQ